MSAPSCLKNKKVPFSGLRETVASKDEKFIFVRTATPLFHKLCFLTSFWSIFGGLDLKPTSVNFLPLSALAGFIRSHFGSSFISRTLSASQVCFLCMIGFGSCLLFLGFSWLSGGYGGGYWCGTWIATDRATAYIAAGLTTLSLRQCVLGSF
jgi:hypothetical protein